MVLRKKPLISKNIAISVARKDIHIVLYEVYQNEIMLKLSDGTYMTIKI